MGVPAVEQRAPGAATAWDLAATAVALLLILPLCFVFIVVTTALLVPLMPGGESELVGTTAAVLSVGSLLGVWACWRRLARGVSAVVHDRTFLHRDARNTGGGRRW